VLTLAHACGRSCLKMSDTVTIVLCEVYDTFNTSRQLRPLVQSMTAEAARTVAAEFISCWLDYCNSLFYGLKDTLLQKLQSVQNATARLISGKRRRDHITPVLRELHCLPIRERVNFKVSK